MILATVAVVACNLNGDIPFQLTTEESNWQMPSYLTDGEVILAAIILGTFSAVLDSNKNKNKNENENINRPEEAFGACITRSERFRCCQTLLKQ